MIPVKGVKNLKNNLKNNLEEFTLLLGMFQSLCERIRAKVSHIFMEEY